MRMVRAILILLMAICASAAAAERPLFTSSSEGPERPRQDAARPGPSLLRLILESIGRDDRADLDSCLARHRLTPGDYGSLLRAIPIEAGTGRTLWFVRPVLEPWCLGLYGAHVFHYFLIEERPAARSRYRLVFENRGDFFAVFRRLHHGLNDIEATGCTAGECHSARLAHDGDTYRPVLCSRTTWNRGREVRRPERC